MKKASLLMGLGLALAMGLAATPKANAGVVVGVRIGAVAPFYSPIAPVYAAPPVVVRPYLAPAPPVAYLPGPYYRHAYVTPGPVFYNRYYPRRFVSRPDFRGYRR
jgi:hypothetical protein